MIARIAQHRFSKIQNYLENTICKRCAAAAIRQTGDGGALNITSPL